MKERPSKKMMKMNNGNGNTTMAMERHKDMEEKNCLQPMHYERTIQDLIT